MTQPRVFVSYFSADSTHRGYLFAMQLIEDLRKAGADVVVDTSSTTDDEFLQRLNQVLPGCQWFILVQTPEVLRSLKVQMEVSNALNLVAAGRMKGALAVIAAPYNIQEMPVAWTKLRSFDASEDYPRALAGLRLTLDLVGPIESLPLVAQPADVPPPAPSINPSSSSEDDRPMPLSGWSATSHSPSSTEDRPAALSSASTPFKKAATPLVVSDSPVALPTPPSPVQRRRLWLTALLVVIVLVLIISSVIGVGRSFFKQGSSATATASAALLARANATATANANTTATVRANATATADAKATAITNFHATATADAKATQVANVHATATADAKATVTAETNATATAETNATATAYASTPEGIYSQATSGSPVLNDPLSNQDGNNWSLNTYCKFTGGMYHGIIQQHNLVVFCFANATNFSNFAFQVQMTIVQGDGGGLIFRNAGSKMYRFRVGQDGTYDLFVSQDDSHSKTLVTGSSSAIQAGLNQSNVVTVIARGGHIYLYVNGQYVAGVSDGTSPSGVIGLFAVDFSNPTDVAFSNAKVWAL